MKIKIIGKELKITEAINDYVEKKLDRIEKYFEDAEADVTLKAEKNVQTAEICVLANGEKFRAVTEDKDMYASIDKDIDILEGQIRKSKTKKEKMMKDASIKTMEVEKDHVAEIANEIIKTSYYEIKPITPEDAVLELQAHPTHNFLAFINVETGKVNVIEEIPYSDGERSKVRCYGANDVREGVAIMWMEDVDVSITGNSTNPTRFQHPVAGTYKKERLAAGKKYFSVASGGGTGRTLHPDNMAAGPASYGMTDTMGRMHSDAQFAGSSSVPAHVEMMGLIGMGNNPMVGASVAVAVAVEEAMK